MNTKEKKDKKVIKLRKSSHDIWMSSLLAALVCTGLLGVGLSTWNYSNGGSTGSGDLGVTIGSVVQTEKYFSLNTSKGDFDKDKYNAHPVEGFIGKGYYGLKYSTSTISENSKGLDFNGKIGLKGNLSYFLKFDTKSFLIDYPNADSFKLQFVLTYTDTSVSHVLIENYYTNSDLLMTSGSADNYTTAPKIVSDYSASKISTSKVLGTATVSNLSTDRNNRYLELNYYFTITSTAEVDTINSTDVSQKFALNVSLIDEVIYK